MTIHDEAHDRAGATVKLDLVFDGADGPVGAFRIEDYWDRVGGTSWMYAQGNPAAIKYAMRAGIGGLPVDDEVVYGKDERGLGHIVHVSELGEAA